MLKSNCLLSGAEDDPRPNPATNWCFITEPPRSPPPEGPAATFTSPGELLNLQDTLSEVDDPAKLSSCSAQQRTFFVNFGLPSPLTTEAEETVSGKTVSGARPGRHHPFSLSEFSP